MDSTTANRFVGRKHRSKPQRRNWATAGERTTPVRANYTGATRHRDTRAMPGHPLDGLWTSWEGMARSHRPTVRAYVTRHIRSIVDAARIDEPARYNGE